MFRNSLFRATQKNRPMLFFQSSAFFQKPSVPNKIVFNQDHKHLLNLVSFTPSQYRDCVLQKGTLFTGFSEITDDGVLLFPGNTKEFPDRWSELVSVADAQDWLIGILRLNETITCQELINEKNQPIYLVNQRYLEPHAALYEPDIKFSHHI